MKAWMRKVLAAVWLLMLAGCDRPPSRAVIGVVFGNGDAMRVAQAVIAETARDGEPVIVLQGNHLRETTVETSFRRAESMLALPDLVAVVGHESSASTLAAAPLYHEAGIPLIVPTSTSPRLGTFPGVFPLPANDSIQGAFLAQFAVRQLGARAPLVWFVTDEYGYGLRDGVTRELTRLGVPAISVIPIAPTSNLPAIVEAAFTREAPDVVLAAARFPEAWDLARLAQQWSPGIRLLAGDGAYETHEAFAIAGPAADSVYLSVYWAPQAADSAGVAFIERFRGMIGRTPVPADAMVFDAIMLAATAIRTVGAHPRVVTRYLEALGSMSPAFHGVTGSIGFEPTSKRPLIMIRARHGDFEPVAAR